MAVIIGEERSVLHAGSSLGRALTPGLKEYFQLRYTNPAKVPFCACSEAETHYYVSWFRRGEGTNTWQRTPQALTSCSLFYLQQKLKCKDVAEICAEGPIRLLSTRRSLIPITASTDLAVGWYLAPRHHRDVFAAPASFPRA